MQQVEVTRVIAAPPGRLYELVSDLPRMGEWSPENTGGRWIDGATGPAVGARFEGTNQKGRTRWSTVATVAVAEPGHEFAFDVTVKRMKVARWGYRLEAAEGGTKVTEYWQDHRNPVMARLTGLALGIRDRATHNALSMEQTLERLASAV